MMNVVGIIAEYNPFHAGHLYHLMETKKRMPHGAVVVAVMSGNFVQRGEPAVIDKWSRARVAVECGVNLVVELPAFYATAAAPDFARGAVEVLRLIGATHISFGSEVASMEELGKMSRSAVDGDYRAELKRQLAAGRSYSAAASIAADSIGCINYPNAVLASEYLRHAEGIEPILVHRRNTHGEEALRESGAGFFEGDSSAAAPNLAYSSAKAIRNALFRGIAERDAIAGTGFAGAGFAEALSAIAGIDYTSAFNESDLCGPVFLDSLDEFVLYFVRSQGAGRLSRVRGIAEGFENRLKSAALMAKNAGELVALSATRRFTESRIKRILIAALLGIEGYTAPQQTYLRVLAYDGAGRALLAALKKQVHIIAKRSKSGVEHPLLEVGDRAEALYSAATASRYTEHSRVPYQLPLHAEDGRQILK